MPLFVIENAQNVRFVLKNVQNVRFVLKNVQFACNSVQWREKKRAARE